MFRKPMEKPYVCAIVPAAGSSRRMNGLDKLLEELDGAPVIIHTLQALAYSDWIDEVVIVTRSEQIAILLDLIRAYDIQKVRSVVAGGETRQQSVAAGLAAASAQTAYIAVHDGARPLVGQQVIADAVISAIQHGAAAAAVPVVDTIKTAGADKLVSATLDRSCLYAMQTPQVFALATYRAALEMATNSGADYTDDCQMLEAFGTPIYLSQGDYANLKITAPVDLLIAQAILEQVQDV